MRFHPALAPVRTLIAALILNFTVPAPAADAEKRAEPAAASASTPAATEEKEEEDPTAKLAWSEGPLDGDLRGRAKVKVPAGFRFLPYQDTGKLMKMMGNRSSGNELGFLANTNSGWAVVFEFDEVGYVKDDEKDELNADKLLESMREGNQAQNEYRKEQGLPPIHIVGWHVKPNYNDQTKNLEWSILGESSGHQFVNYNVRILGRHGVTEATLIEDADKVDKTLPDFRTLLKEFNYSTGESYAEFKSGDKIAEYGLGALVLGGAAAVGYKVGFLGMLAGFFKKFFKLVIAGVVVVGVALKNFFAKLFGRRPPTDGSAA